MSYSIGPEEQRGESIGASTLCGLFVGYNGGYCQHSGQELRSLKKLQAALYWILHVPRCFGKRGEFSFP